jgi:DNA repair exonuclease SbcCD ATPase subunit
VWIERLEVQGFGRLRGDFAFPRGITLVTGPNESGKSTLHQALMRSLFGFDGRDRRRTGGESVLQRWCPWQGPPFGVATVVHCADDRVLRATWRFDRAGSSQELLLIDERTGEDLTAEVLESRGDTKLGRYLLDLDYAEFCQVCMLEQAAIGTVERTDSLVNALRRAAEMGASEVGVEQAKELLAGALGGPDIGVRRNNLAPLASGALRQSQDRLQETDLRLEGAEKVQKELRDLSSTLSDVHKGLEELRRRRLATEQELLLIRSRSFAERIERAEQSEAQARYKPDESARLDPEAEEHVRSALRDLDRLEAQHVELSLRAEAAQEAVKELEAERIELERQMRDLAAYESVDGSAHEQVGALIARYEELGREPAAEPAAAPAGPRPSPAALALAGVVAVASLLAGLLVSPFALLGLAAAVAIAIADALRQPARYVEGVPRGAGSEGRSTEVEKELQEALDAVDASPAAEAVLRARSYLDACRKRSEHDRAAARHAEIRAELLRVGEPARDARGLAERIETIRAEVLRALEGLGIDPSDFQGARRRFDELAQAAREARARLERAEGAKEALDTALGDASLEELRRRLEDTQARLKDHRTAHGELAPGEASEEEEAIEDRLTEIGDDVNDARGEVGRLEALVQEREDALADVPALREERIEVAERIERIEDAAEALKIAEGALTEASSNAYRQFAPVLNEAIARHLPTITGGRYERARVSEELAITLDTPETGDSVPAEALSRGTQDQIYLVERLAILGMLATGDEVAPLLLDDVFVHFDERRLAFALEVIGHEAESRQVLLFAGDPRIGGRLEDLGIEHSLVALEGP